MAHRAEQIIDAIVSRLRASATLGIASANVFEHRSLSLSDDQGEMPALTVNYGEDEAADEITMLDGTIGSLLEILTKAYVIGDDEVSVRRALLDVRTETHKAINLLQTLGLSFVVRVAYGGAAAPEIDTEGGRCIGAQESRWAVLYHLGPTDPS